MVGLDYKTSPLLLMGQAGGVDQGPGVFVAGGDQLKSR